MQKHLLISLIYSTLAAQLVLAADSASTALSNESVQPVAADETIFGRDTQAATPLPVLPAVPPSPQSADNAGPQIKRLESVYRGSNSDEARRTTPAKTQAPSIGVGSTAEAAMPEPPPVLPRSSRSDTIRNIVIEALGSNRTEAVDTKSAGTNKPSVVRQNNRQLIREAVSSAPVPRGSSEDGYLSKLKHELSTSTVLKESKPGIDPVDSGKGGIDEYTVKQNDSLWKIAVRVYGNGHRWKYLYDTNRNRITSADVLRVGQTLSIPRY